MPAFRRHALAACLVLAACLPAAAQDKVKQVRLPTAADGEVTYSFDAATNLPISAKDERAEVMAVALSFEPKKAGESLRWNYYYALQFGKGPKPTMVTVYAEDKKPLTLEVGDSAPAPEAGVWSATSRPRVVDKKTWDSMIGKDPWFIQRKFVINYADGSQRTLHQLSVVTQTMRLELLEKVTGQKLLAPATK